MSVIYVDPNPWTEVTFFEIALWLLPVLVPMAMTLKIMRYLAAVRRFGTAQLDAAQRLELYAHHGAVRWLAHATMALTMIFVGLVLQAGITAELGRGVWVLRM